MTADLHDKIAKEAHNLYVRRKQENPNYHNTLADWLDAERYVRINLQLRANITRRTLRI